MHELAIGETICKTIETEAAKRGMAKISHAKLKIGKMNAFQRENLEVCLKRYATDERLSELKFEIEEIPVQLKCTVCNEEYTDDRFDDYDFAHKVSHAPALYEPPTCPECGAPATKITVISGQELELVSIGE